MFTARHDVLNKNYKSWIKYSQKIKFSKNINNTRHSSYPPLVTVTTENTTFPLDQINFITAFYSIFEISQT